MSTATANSDASTDATAGTWLLQPSQWLFPKCFQLTPTIFLLEIAVRLAALNIGLLDAVAVAADWIQLCYQLIFDLANSYYFMLFSLHQCKNTGYVIHLVVLMCICFSKMF